MATQLSPAARTLSAEVVVNGSVGHAGRRAELQIIEVLRSAGLSLGEAAGATIPTAGTWQSVARSTSAGPCGRLRLHLATLADARLVRATLHDKAFQQGADLVSLTVIDDSTLAAQANNGRRGARRCAGPPGAPTSTA